MLSSQRSAEFSIARAMQEGVLFCLLLLGSTALAWCRSFAARCGYAYPPGLGFKTRSCLPLLGYVFVALHLGLRPFFMERPSAALTPGMVIRSEKSCHYLLIIMYWLLIIAYLSMHVFTSVFFH